MPSVADGRILGIEGVRWCTGVGGKRDHVSRGRSRADLVHHLVRSLRDFCRGSRCASHCRHGGWESLGNSHTQGRGEERKNEGFAQA